MTIASTEKKCLIKATDLSIKYVQGASSDDMQTWVYKMLGSQKVVKKKEFWALSQVSFEAYSGEIIGIIGSNGAGKSTLCKTIAKMLMPDKGSIEINGSVVSILSLGVGFNMELSGRENIYLNGAFLGLSGKNLDDKAEEIIQFSGLEEFIDQPIKNYSSGMIARLGFSVSSAIESDILILDEALSAGDHKFASKAAQKMQEMVSDAKLVIIVSHQIDFVKNNCTKAMWIDDGTIKAFGDPKSICETYMETVRAKMTLAKGIEQNFPMLERSKIVKDYIVLSAKNMYLNYKVKVFGAKTKKAKKYFWPINDMSFDIKEGEIIGVIGPNGAGKSTLCKIIAGILRPDSGSIWVNGKTSALLSIGTGFNYQLSGRDNIFLNGMLLGIPKHELESVYDEIVGFAELENFIHEPVKNYSNGMISRLAFSIAVMIKPDILIIDEALNAGDSTFYEKSSRKILELIQDAKAVIIVSHNLKFIENICNRVLYIDKGAILYDDIPEKVIANYVR